MVDVDDSCQLSADSQPKSPLNRCSSCSISTYKTDRQNSYKYTHPFNGPLSGTTRVSRYQKGKINLDFTEARDTELHWHLLGHMQVCTSLQSDNHASTTPLNFYRPDALPAAQPTASKHRRHKNGYKSGK